MKSFPFFFCLGFALTALMACSPSEDGAEVVQSEMTIEAAGVQPESVEEVEESVALPEVETAPDAEETPQQSGIEEPAAASPVTEEAVAGAAPVLAASGLPEGPGRQEFEAICSQCHMLNMATDAPRSAAAWNYTVEDMRARGAMATDSQVELIVNYLSQHFGI